MKFYYWLLIIIIIINALVMFTSFGEYIKNILVIRNPDMTTLTFALLAFCIVLIAFGFLFMGLAKY
jgi:hypothetical protein